MTIHSQTVTETIADGLDALTDGRGFNADHMRATLLANAAPDLLDALNALIVGKLTALEISNMAIRAVNKAQGVEL